MLKGLSRHPSSGDWAAYLDQRLDAATHARMRAHLHQCGRCQGVVERIDAIRSILDLPIPEPDELSWRRMELRLLDKVQTPGETKYFSIDLPPSRMPPFEHPEPTVSLQSTIDLIRSRRWLLSGAVAVAVVAVFVTLVPVSPRLKPTSPVDEASLVLSGSAPLEVELESGHRLSLATETEVMVSRPNLRPPSLRLEHGRIRVRSPAPIELGDEPFVVRTPDHELRAHSRDFAVAYRGGRARIDVAQGYVDPRGGARIHKGESRALDSSGSPEPAEPRIGFIDRVLGRSNKDPADANRSSEPRPRPSGVQAEVRRSRPPPTASLPVPLEPRPELPGRSESPSGPPGGPKLDNVSAAFETRVERLGSTLSPAQRAWAEANRAWYHLRDEKAAISAAKRVVELEKNDRALVGGALELICQAQVTLQDGRAALSACSVLLDHEKDTERTRRIHYTLATIFRDLLSDCPRAIEQYGKALVFGGRGRFDDMVRLRRAECALEVNDLELARSDLNSLANRTTETIRMTRALRRLEELEKEESKRHQ